MNGRATTRFPLARGDLIDSVDTVHLVHRLSLRPNDRDLEGRGFGARPGKLVGSTTWFHNPPGNSHKPNLTLYENFGPGYGLRVNSSLPKMAIGRNFDLLDDDGIFNCLKDISIYVTETAGIEFDALTACVARIDFATNLDLLPNEADQFLERSRRLVIPRMRYRGDLSLGRSVYHGNDSRMIRIYDKSSESRRDANEVTRIRLEYQMPNESATRRFADRMGLDSHMAETLLSPGARLVAICEVIDMLHLDTFDPNAIHSVASFFEQTKDLNQARRCSSFADAYKTLGPNFYELSGSRMSRQRYLKELRECQRLGF